MSITNTTKPTPVLTNITKPATGETWASILTSWALETRTWLATGSYFTNATRQTSSITNTVRP